jgi:nitrite reductase/ring-hydroxylating ferredoxin subunit
MHLSLLLLLSILQSWASDVLAFNFVLMGVRRGKGALTQNLEGSSKDPRALNQGKGQEITGVTLPADGTIKGWEFGDGVRLVCANVGGKFYAVQGDCPRCAFDLWKGDLIFNDPAWTDLPRVACPTCSTTFSMNSGKRGPPIKRNGLQAFVGKLAKTATSSDGSKDAKAFLVTRDPDGRVYCRER